MNFDIVAGYIWNLAPEIERKMWLISGKIPVENKDLYWSQVYPDVRGKIRVVIIEILKDLEKMKKC